VTDLASATAAIEAIVDQGEGSRGDWRDAHFGRFKRILDEYLAMRVADPTFEPARPVVAARVRVGEGDAGGPLIGEPLTARVADLFNVAYEVLLQVLYRLLSRIDESDSQTAVLADVAVGLMYDAIEPLGRMLGTMPVGPEHPGASAGAPFELFYQPDYLLPHHRAAWAAVRRATRRGGIVCGPAVGGGPAHRRDIDRADRPRRATQVVRLALF
jgi:hypothetical protein